MSSDLYLEIRRLKQEIIKLTAERDGWKKEAAPKPVEVKITVEKAKPATVKPVQPAKPLKLAGTYTVIEIVEEIPAEQQAELEAALEVVTDLIKRLYKAYRKQYLAELDAAQDLAYKAPRYTQDVREFTLSEINRVKRRVDNLITRGKVVCDICGKNTCTTKRSCAAKRSAAHKRLAKAQALYSELHDNADCGSNIACNICEHFRKCKTALANGITGGDYRRIKRDKDAPSTVQIRLDRQKHKAEHGVLVVPGEIS